MRISTTTHGILDYATAGLLLTLPRALGWGERVTNTLTALGLGTIGYSLLTDYELGVRRVIPMRAHLMLDAASGAMLCAAPWMFPDEVDGTKAALVGLGVFEIAAAVLTRPEPFASQSVQMAESFGQADGVPTISQAEGIRRSSTDSNL